MNWKVSWWKKDCGSSLEKRCCRIDESGLRKKATKATHEDNFSSSWLREDGKNKEEIIGEASKETEKETGKKRIEEEEREKDSDRQKKVYQFCVD